MSLLSFLVFIAHGNTIPLYVSLDSLTCGVQGTSLRKGFSMRSPEDDADLVALFVRLLRDAENCPSALSAALEQGIAAKWEEAYDNVNPYGDRRGSAFQGVWTFNLDTDLLYLAKEDSDKVAPLRLARQGSLTLEDFQTLSPSPETCSKKCALPSPYWEPRITPNSLRKAISGRILRDFGHAWRHVLRRRMNSTTFMRLAYATVWISALDFTIRERLGFEHITGGGPYVYIIDLPRWETPSEHLFRVGECWFVLAQDIKQGLEMVRCHRTKNGELKNGATLEATYAILTLHHVVLCKASGSELGWTKAAPLFEDPSCPSDAAIDMILWSIDVEPQETALNHLPVEIHDKILPDAAVSPVASAKLGCELGLGSPFLWLHRGREIGIETNLRHRTEYSPVESYILLNGVMSGLAYKRS
ncbi:hypothetical protein LLEC1_05120 [Akanthomyces lecanii]|uniref:Heterokaryon incompatibility domain-containing protein n=1 Tax=Cordyceps confragosa TaxID=2714763 RepID=A0A179IVI7_CORDF|nr:hypothetical protein LLEC1_05120 [Akanthomyces lecanii]